MRGQSLAEIIAIVLMLRQYLSYRNIKINSHQSFAQNLGCEKELGLNREITNVDGSGIGLGHPIGSSGVRIMVTLLYAMKKRGKTLRLPTFCGGGGVSMACGIQML
jgi:acetyl-CoA C-acetyltransferase